MTRWAVVAVTLAACRHGGAPVAGPCPTAPVVVAAQAQVDALAGCASLAALHVRSAAPLDLTPLGGLVEVTGDLTIGPTLAITSVGLPALRRVGGTFRLDSGGLVSGVFAPQLTAVGGLTMRDAPALTTVSVPALTTVAGDVRLERVPALEHVDALALTTVVGDLVVIAPALSSWLGLAPQVGGVTTVQAPVGPGA
ncbi:MAG: hypothetical protein R3B06_17955 [Kofleriaceae bacterium]